MEIREKKAQHALIMSNDFMRVSVCESVSSRLKWSGSPTLGSLNALWWFPVVSLSGAVVEAKTTTRPD